MKQTYGMSNSGNLPEAVQNIREPKALLLMTNEANFEKHVEELQNLFPDVPSIGCVGMSYVGEKTCEKGVTVIALSEGIEAVSNVIENLSTMPVKYISRLIEDVSRIQANSQNTVVFDFACGHDDKLLTTLNSYLSKKNISLVGGTGDCNKVSVNGKIYTDACAYLILKNTSGKIKVYKENIYRPGDKRFIATKTDRSRNLLIEVDGKSAEQTYLNALGISREAVQNQTFQNPFGHIYGDEVYLISVKDVVSGGAMECFRTVNNLDVLTIMEIEDYREVVQHTIAQIQSDFGNRISAVLSVNCLFRYLLFNEEKYWNDYLRNMNTLGNHAGVVGYGEHYNTQHVNQTMCCVVFE